MAGSSTARGAKADSDAEQSAADAAVTVSDAGVEVSPSVTDKFERVELFHRNGTTKTVDNLEAKIAAEFDGFSTSKPKGFDEAAKARQS
jgi:hypothetical protein